jgi:hypothetical protein
MTTSLAPNPTDPLPDAGRATSVASPGRGLLARIGELASTTPGRLRVESVLVTILAVVTGLFIGFVVADRLSGTSSIRDQAVPLIVDARQVQTHLAEANAAAAAAVLAGGVENPDQRAIYEQSLSDAGAALESAASLAGDDAEAHRALQALTSGLPRYAGLIETARANNRQGFPVSSAYLNSASRLLETDLYPATDVVANRAADRYRTIYDRQRGLSLILGLVAVGLTLGLVASLGYLMVQLGRRFKRTLNLPIAVGLLVAAALCGWLVYGLVNQSLHLERARVDGYEGTRLYLDARGIGFGAKADEARFLIARGAGEPFEDTFQARAAQFTASAAALDDHGASSARAGAGADTAGTEAAWNAYTVVHEQIINLDRTGERAQAVTLALTPVADSAFTAFDTITGEALAAEQQQFGAEMDRAERALRGLQVGAIVAVILIGAAAALGLQQRINEYR